MAKLLGGTIVYGTGTVQTILYVQGTTSSTSTASGALQVVGGAGIGRDLYVGGTIYGTFSGSVTGAATSATNIVGGSAGFIPIQSAAGITTFINTGSVGNILQQRVGNTATFESTSTLQVGYSIYANTATNVAAGTAGQLNYQSGVGATSFAGPGNSGQLLMSSGTSAPLYVNTASVVVGNAVNIAAGTAGQLHYQSSVGTTAFVSTGSVGQILMSSGTSAPLYVNTSSIVIGNAANIAGGLSGFIPIQSGVGTTAFIATGTVGYLLQMQPGNTASWVSTASIISPLANTATNISGGVSGQLHYQSAPGVTSFVNTGTRGDVLVSNGSGAPTYNNTLTLTGTDAAVSIASGALQVGGGVGISGDAYLGGSFIQVGGTHGTLAATYNLINTTATTVNFAGAGTIVSIGAVSGTTTVKNNLTVVGNLTIQGTTTVVDSTVTNIADPIITLGGGAGNTAPSVDDNKDRGVAFKWFSGGAVRTGFFGYQDSTGFFTFISSATIANEVVAAEGGSTKGALDAYLAGGTAQSLVYQSSPNVTSFLAAGTSGFILQTNGTGSAPSWVPATGLSAGSANSATNISGGTAGLIPIQSGAGTTAFINTGSVGNILQQRVGNTATFVSTSTLQVGYSVYSNTATQLQTVGIATNASYYPSFVDSNNATAIGELHYTTSTFSINPSTGVVTLTSTAAATSTSSGALQVRGGVGVGGNLNVGGVLNTFNKNTDGIRIATNYASGGNGTNDYGSLGFYGNLGGAYDNKTGEIRSYNDGGFYGRLEFFVRTNGASAAGTDTTRLIKIGGQTNDVIVYSTVSSVSTDTGALQVVGGVGVGGRMFVGGGMFVGGTVTATNFVGAFSGTISGTATNATTLVTVSTATNASYYPSFVDSNNATAIGELHYTTSSFYINPYTGVHGVGSVVINSTSSIDTTLSAYGGIATATKLMVYGDINMGSFGTVGAMGMRYANGTVGSPISVTQDDRLGALFHGAYHSSIAGTGWQNPVLIATFVDGSTSTVSTGIPGRLVLYTTPLNGPRTERMRIDSVGRVSIGANAASTWTSTYSVLELNNHGTIYGTSAGLGLASNMFYDGANWQVKTVNSSTLVALSSGPGNVIFYRAASGAVGSTAALLESMRITYNGGISFGISGTAYGSSGQILQSNGDAAPTWVSTGTLTAGIATTSSQLQTVGIATNATYFPSFVDSNNATAIGELHYTTSSFSINPSTGVVTHSSAAVATSTSTGALRVTGGVGVGGDLYAKDIYTNGVKAIPLNIQEFTATDAQTTFTVTGGYTVGTVQVFANGINLGSGDFTASNGTTVIVGQARKVSDIIRIISGGTSSSINNIQSFSIAMSVAMAM